MAWSCWHLAGSYELAEVWHTAQERDPLTHGSVLAAAAGRASSDSRHKTTVTGKPLVRSSVSGWAAAARRVLPACMAVRAAFSLT